MTALSLEQSVYLSFVPENQDRLGALLN